MAKFEREFMANFDEFLSFVEKRGANLGVSSTIEDSTNFVIDDTKVESSIVEDKLHRAKPFKLICYNCWK